MRYVDLSAPITASPEGTPEHFRTEITRSSHSEGAAQARALLGVGPELLRDGEGWATETITRLGTHDTTHVDAPLHYNSRIAGQVAAAVDQLPLEWFFGDGLCLDVTAMEDGRAITPRDLDAALERAGRSIEPGNIVLLRTGRDRFYDAPDYMFRGPGVTPEATRVLYDRGVRVMGIDAWGWDAPLDRQAKEARQRGEAGVFWAAHQCGLSYAHIERLVNLGALPAAGFKVCCFLLRIEGGSAGPARVVAIVG